jgi:uncharacterized protein (TIGR03086 family)
MSRDWLQLQQLAHRTFTVHVTNVTDWSAPTPDADWDVRQLVSHVIEEQQWAPQILAGRTAGEARARMDPLGSDLAAEWRRYSEAAMQAWTRADLSAPVTLRYDTMPAADYLTEQVADVVVHTWDLARAIGGDERLDDALVEAAWSIFEPQRATLEASGLYAAPVPTDAGMPLQSQLLALTGRDDRVVA